MTVYRNKHVTLAYQKIKILEFSQKKFAKNIEWNLSFVLSRRFSSSFIAEMDEIC